jgi:hypothetical protein
MKKIMWENWNEKEIELTEGITSLEGLMAEIEQDEETLMQAESGIGSIPFMTDLKPSIVQTPFGAVSCESALKPSDRWQCWLGYTNFDLTHRLSDKMKVINGVEAMRIMSRYTFCVGVGKMFNFTSVRKEIENAICK